MYIKEMSNALEEYHAFMETQANRTVFQTPEWGEVKTDGSWTRDVLLVMSDNHEPVAAAMILYRKLPGVNKFLAYAPRGIVTDYTNAEQLKSVFATLKVYLKAKNAFGLKIDPELQWREWTNKFEMVEGGFNNEEYRKNILAAGFVERPMDLGFDGIQPRLTMILPLKDEGKGIVETFNKKERYKVNVAKKQGVVCYKGTLEDMPIYDELNKITAERDKYVARSIEYLTTMYQHLYPKGMVDLYFAKVDYNVQLAFATNRLETAQKEFDKLTGQLETLNNPKRIENVQKQIESLKVNIAKYEKEIERVKGDLEKYPEGKVVSGAFVVTYLDKAYYLYGANITDDGGLNANKALVSWIMQTLYDEKGIRSFDFFGVSEDQEHHGGINGFKQSFDPELVEYIGEFDMPISKFWFEMFHTWAPKAVSLKNKILVRRKK